MLIHDSNFLKCICFIEIQEKKKKQCSTKIVFKTNYIYALIVLTDSCYVAASIVERHYTTAGS